MSEPTTYPHVRHFNRASLLDRLGSNGRPLRELTDDIGRGTRTEEDAIVLELQHAITLNNNNERTF